MEISKNEIVYKTEFKKKKLKKETKKDSWQFEKWEQLVTSILG